MKNQVGQKITLAILAEGRNSPANWVGELFENSTDAESLVVSIKEKLASFRLFYWWHHNGSYSVNCPFLLRFINQCIFVVKSILTITLCNIYHEHYNIVVMEIICSETSAGSQIQMTRLACSFAGKCSSVACHGTLKHVSACSIKMDNDAWPRAQPLGKSYDLK